MRLTEKQFSALKGGKCANDTKHKYGAVRCVVDGINFGSKAEMHYYAQLKLSQRAGAIKFFLMQVPFILPGNIKYRIDFIVFHNDGKIDFVDVKGAETQVFKIKKKQVEESYPIKITIAKVKNGRFRHECS